MNHHRLRVRVEKDEPLRRADLGLDDKGSEAVALRRTLVRHAVLPPAIGLLALGHLTLAMFLAVVTISVPLRMFGRFPRHMQEGKELQKGNVAVAIFIAALFLSIALIIGHALN